jgi:hypothetical protein
MKVISFFLGILILVSCGTPSRLGMYYKGKKIFTTTTKTIENPNINLVVNSLSKEDAGYDVKGLKNRFIPYVYKNEVLTGVIQNYPDAKIEMVVEPSEHIKRTWILDALMIFDGIWPLTPWWGSTDLSAVISVTLPDKTSHEYKFIASKPFSIIAYPYYRGGRILTEKYYQTYTDLFEQVGRFDFAELAEKPSSQYAASNNLPNKYIFKFRSDVDRDIPDLGAFNQNRFALIIGNEDYASQQTDLAVESNVEFARNDASAFREYAIHALGIPAENIELLLDATTGKMKQSLSRLSLLAKNSRGDAEIYFYYAGHGLPDEITKEPFLIPVDISGKNVTDGIKLSDTYRMLTEYPSKRVVVFLDACFSGGARSQGLLSSRGIKIKPKEELLNGNLVVFSASSGEQASLGYSIKEHGLFTYYLLKKLKESKANITYKELADYLNDEVGLNSVVVNSKEQNPQTNVSSQIKNQWQNWKLN